MYGDTAVIESLLMVTGSLHEIWWQKFILNEAAKKEFRKYINSACYS